MRKTSARRASVALVAALLVSLAAGLLLVPVEARPADKPTPTKQQVHSAQSKARTAARAVGSGQAKLATVQARLDRLNRNAEVAAEAYDGAVYKLGLATKAAQQAGARADAAQAKYAASQGVVDRFAVAAYRSGANFGAADVFLGVDGPGGAVTRANTLAAVGASVQRALETAQAAKIVAGVLRQQANAALGAQRSAEAAVHAAKAKADTAVAQQQSKLSALQAEVTRLTASLQRARTTAASLVQDRKDGLAKALARKRALERAQRLAAARKAEEAREAARAPQAGSSTSGGGAAVVVVPSHRSRGTTAGAARAIAYAKAQLGKPYVYAADGPGSFDCSGLTMRAWEAGGVSLPHWSVAQYEQSQPVSPGQARAGDLVFFASSPGDYRSIYHVGLYLGGGMMIEAPHTGDVVKIIAVYPNDFFGYARP